MRKRVFQMMTTLDGRLDDPLSWMGEVIDAQYDVALVARIQALKVQPGRDIHLSGTWRAHR